MKTNRNKQRAMNLEAMEKRELFAADLMAIGSVPPEPVGLLLPAVQAAREAARRTNHTAQSDGVDEADVVKSDGTYLTSPISQAVDAVFDAGETTQAAEESKNVRFNKPEPQFPVTI